MSQSMARYLAEGDAQAERHVMTLAFLNLASVAVMAGLATWLLSGLPTAPDHPERVTRLALATGAVLNALVNALLWRGLARLSRWARALQFLAALLALPLVPVGTVWGGYALWVLGHPQARRIFSAEYAAQRPSRRMPEPAPFVGALVAATTLGTAVVVGVFVRGRVVWLEQRVAAAAQIEAQRRAELGRTFEGLREAGGFDALPPSAASLVPSASRPARPAGQ